MVTGRFGSRCILTVLMVVIFVTGSMSLPAFADTDEEGYIQVSDWQTIRQLVGTSSQEEVKIRLTDNVTVSSGYAHNEGNTVEIDLNGFTVNGNSLQAFWNEKGTMTIKNGTITNGRNDYGGALNNRGTMVLENVDIKDSIGDVDGGGIMNYGTLTMTGGSITGCKAGRGAGLRIVPHGSDSSAIAQSATAVLTDVEISGNTADGRNDTYGRGGGIGVSRGTLTMTGCTVTGNKSTDDDGGGIDFDSSGKTLTLKDTVISGNSVTHSDREGGGVNLERGSAKIEDCTISGNAAPDGGGIYISNAFGTVTICGTTKITDNRATVYGGGGICNKATLELKDDITVTGNTAGESHSGGIYHDGSAIRMQGRIVVKDNSNCNVQLANSKKIDVTGVIDDASHIGVNLTSGCYVITSGFDATGNTNPEVFVPDNGKDVELDEDGEVRIKITGAVLPGDLLDSVTVSFHPVGQQSSLCIKGNGGGAGQNVVHLYKLGDSFRFWLTKADDDSYYIDFFGGTDDYSPSNKRLDLSDNDGYDTVGNVVHVVKGNKDAMNKRWRFIRNDDGTYYIQNKESELYWDLQDSGYDNKNKLCQRTLKDAQKWELEIVHEDGNSTMNYLKRYDSYTFSRNGKSVTGANWMSFIPNDMVLSDVTIPGTHDAATAYTETQFNYMAQCQQLSINDQLYSGVRYFDLRLNRMIWLIHGSYGVVCEYKGKNLEIETVMDWIKDFLKNNPKETVILQIKADVNTFNLAEPEIYDFYKDMMKDNPDLFYVGDHVPKMGECRGKIVILSRLEHYDNSDFKYEGNKQWALDVSAWKAWTERMSDPMDLTASGDNYEVWTQDFHKKVGDDKWTLITNSVFNKKTGAEAKHAAVKAKGKECWTVSYSSCVSMGFPVKWPQEAAREQNPRLVDKLLTDEDVLDGQFLGVVCSDFSDQQLAYLVYKQNFINDTEKVTIRGITSSGYEPIKPMTIDVPRYETLDNALDTASVRKQIDEYFSSDVSFRPYGYYNRGEVEQLKRKPMSQYAGAEEYKNDPVHLEDLHGYDKPTLYVALDQVINTMDRRYELDVEAPACGTTVTGADDWTLQTPKPVIDIRGGSVKLRLVEKDGVPKTYWCDDTGELFEGTIEGGGKYYCAAEFETYWGFCLSDVRRIHFYVYMNDEQIQDVYGVTLDPKHISSNIIGLDVPHDLKKVEEKDATCTEGGLSSHYYCAGCGKRFDASDITTEVSDEDVIIPALGHDWITGSDTDEDGWKVTKEATDDEAGEETRTCSRCSETETRVIPALVHDHVLEWVEEKDATCENEGSKGYFLCSGGDHPCGRFFSDAEGKTEIDKAEAVIPALGHQWLDPEYTWSEDSSRITAEMVCMRDHDHIQTETADVKTEVTKEASCDEPGESILTASFENSAFAAQTKEETLPALGHDWDKGEITKKATCTEDGEKTYTCSRDSSHKKTEVIKATGHDEDIRTASDTATCTAGGIRTIETYCTVCGEVLDTKQEPSEALGHSWSEPEYTWSDDMKKVTASHYCLNECGAEEEETVDVVLIETDPEPTCEEAGVKTWYSSDFENEEFYPQEKTEEIPALGHDWGEWTVTRQATDTENGEEKRTCKNDSSHIQTRIIPAGNHEHSLKHYEEKAATCEEAGSIEYWVCEGEKSSCSKFFSDAEGNNEIEEKDTVVEALGHDWGDWTEDVPANCTYRGEEIRTCKRDESHQEIRKTAIDSNAHVWGDWVVTKEATETEEGEETRTCKLDDSHKETRTIPKVISYKVTFKVTGGAWDDGDAGDKTVTLTGHEGDELKLTAGQIPEAGGNPDAGYMTGSWIVTPDEDTIITKDTTYTYAYFKETAPVTIVRGKLLAKMTAKGKNSLLLAWNKVKEVKGYDIFLSKCGKGKKVVLVKSVKGNKTFSWTKKSLKKQTSYKAVVKAFVMKNGRKSYVRTSPMIHAYASGGTKNYTNPGKVTVKKTSVSLKKGKTYKISAAVTKLQKGKKLMTASHAPKLRYISSDNKIASVTKAGRITAKGKGSCKVYVIAVNGIRKTVDVTVR